MITDAEIREILNRAPRGTIIVNLDGDAEYNAISLKDFKLAIRNRQTYIVTPLTTALNNDYCLMGYRLIVQSEGYSRCINDMLLGDIGENERELRLAHNIEKMILGGVYGLETEWKR